MPASFGFAYGKVGQCTFYNFQFPVKKRKKKRNYEGEIFHDIIFCLLPFSH